LRHTDVMTRARDSGAEDASVVRLDWALRCTVLAVTVGSLLVVWRNEPGTLQVGGGAIVLLGGVLVVVLRRNPRVLVVASAVAGGVAVSLTSREFFSFWPAGCALLVASALTHPAWTRLQSSFIAAVAAITGVVVAALGPQPQVAAPLLPVAAAAVAFVVLTGAARRLTHTRELERRAAAYQHRAELSEAANLELERRTALARELHDSLGHHVTAMVVQAEAGRVARADEALASIAALGRDALDELETVVFDLRARSNDTSRTAEIDLQWIDSKLAGPLRRQGVDVKVQVATSMSDVALVSAAYRIVQEALTNVMRHAAATTVSVVVQEERGDLVVRVHDDGIGLPAGMSEGHGFAGIRERAGELGGEARVSPVQPHGTLVQARLPGARE